MPSLAKHLMTRDWQILFQIPEVNMNTVSFHNILQPIPMSAATPKPGKWETELPTNTVDLPLCGDNRDGRFLLPASAR